MGTEGLTSTWGHGEQEEVRQGVGCRAKGFHLALQAAASQLAAMT